MRYIIIDPVAHTISEHDHPGQIDWRVIRDAVKGPICGAGILPNGDILWVNDEGLLHGPNHYFSAPQINQPRLAGVGMITGPENLLPPGAEPGEEEINDATSSIEDLRREVVFLDRMQVTETTTTEHQMPGVTVINVQHRIEPA